MPGVAIAIAIVKAKQNNVGSWSHDSTLGTESGDEMKDSSHEDLGDVCGGSEETVSRY